MFLLFNNDKGSSLVAISSLHVNNNYCQSLRGVLEIFFSYPFRKQKCSFLVCFFNLQSVDLTTVIWKKLWPCLLIYFDRDSYKLKTRLD